MPALAPGQSSGCALPALQLFAIDPNGDGFLRDIDNGTFEVLDPDGTLVAGPTAIDLADCPAGNRLGRGRYVAPWTVPTNEKLGAHRIRWTYQFLATGPTHVYERSFEVLGSVSAPLARAYTTVAAMRAEGVSAAKFSAGRVRDLIVLASQFVERYTGRVFEPTAKTFKVNGHGEQTMLLNEPIVALADLTIDTSPFSPSDLPIDPSLVRVYNRHLSQGLLDPDDRDNPKVSFFHANDDIQGLASFSFDRLHFPRGEQNITFEGVFGYTDPDGVTLVGATPILIEHATKLLVVRNLAKLSDADARSDGLRGWQVTELRTRDQQIKYGFPDARSAGVGAFSGDPEIDTILAGFIRPLQLGAA